MALIPCPKCKKMVSSKASSCIHCNLKFNNLKKCDKCGYFLTENDTKCPNCGYQQTNKVKTSSSKKRKKFYARLIVAPFLAVVLYLAIYFGVNGIINYRKTTYDLNYREAVNILANGAKVSEQTGNMVYKVWRNSIMNESNPITDRFTRNYSGKYYDNPYFALSILYDDKDFNERLQYILDCKRKSYGLMSRLSKPPKEYKEKYDALLEYYEACNEFMDLAIEPQGAFLGYGNAISDCDEKVSEKLKEINKQFDDLIIEYDSVEF